MRACLVVLVLAGCLSKPSAPGVSGDGGIDGMGDAGDAMSDGGSCATPLPDDLVLRRIARVAQVDAGDTDDIIVFGRRAGGTGASEVYLILGREPMNLSCYDRRFTVVGDEILDAFIGDVTSDGAPELLLFSREDDGSQDTYVVEMYLGEATGGFAATADVQATTIADGFGMNIGGDLANPLPAYVLGMPDGNPRHVIFGGLFEPFGSMDVVGATLASPRIVRNASGAPLDLIGAVQEMGVHPMDSGPRVIVVTNDQVYVLDYASTVGTESRYSIVAGPVALGGGGNKFARFFRMQVGTQRTVALAPEGNPIEGVRGFDVIEYDATLGIRRRRLDHGLPMGTSVEDLSFGFIDDTQLDLFDLAALTKSGVGSTLSVFRDIDLESGPFEAPQPVQLQVIAGANAFAIGNFDGNPATADQIIAFSTSVQGTLGACYQYVADGTGCLRPCGATTCP